MQESSRGSTHTSDGAGASGTLRRTALSAARGRRRAATADSLRPHCRPARTGDQGLVLLKIDGLSWRQIRRAFSRGRMPHLQRLTESDHRLRPLYSGVPSTTPAVQAELFYGVRTNVPAVAYYDRGRNATVNLLQPADARRQSRGLASRGKPLLHGGTAYADIFSGGAEGARYCTETLRIRSVGQYLPSTEMVARLATQPLHLLRMIAYGSAECGFAVGDFIAGVHHGRHFLRELKLVPMRVLIGVVLRELIRMRVKMDLARGIPIIHASFLGYDEQAHRRGPDSAFAHRSLKGIDAVIADLDRTARRTDCRNYRLVVYSDHGQEKAVPYSDRFGRSIQTAVAGIVAGRPEAAVDPSTGVGSGLMPLSRRRPTVSSDRRRPATASGDGIRVLAMGPLGHVYLSARPPSGDQKAQLARALVDEGRIPLVLYRSGEAVMAVNRRGRFDALRDAETILGRKHPFANLAAEDLVRTCRHGDAGDLVISGWTPEGPPLTFAEENGAHGGPGSEETCGFAILPEAPAIDHAAMRPLDLRDWVLDAVGARHPTRPAPGPP